MVVRLHNPTMANVVMSRFDAEGYVTCGHLEDIRMLVEQGCEIINVLEDETGMNNTQFYLVDFKNLVSRVDADAHLERELNKVITENWRVFMSKNGKVLLHK
ncbi:hypothetical protein ALPO108162_09590 [Alicyclobacillus pomorum]